MASFSARFLTKDKTISIPDNQFELQSTFGPKELTGIVKTVINENLTIDEALPDDGKLLSFLINGRLLRSSIQTHLEDEDQEPLNYEKIIDIEYFISKKPPSPVSTCSSNDWISCIHVNDRVIINGCYDGLINMWSLTDNKHLIGLPAHCDAVKDIKWIPNESMQEFRQFIDGDDFFFVSTSYDETVCVWRWNLSKDEIEKLSTCIGHSRSVDCVDVSNDLLATGSYDRSLKIWSLAEKQDNHNDDNIFESGLNGDSSDTEKASKKAKQDKDNVQINNFTSECKLEVKKTSTKNPLMTLTEHSEAITDLIWIKSGKSRLSTAAKLATCSMDNTIKQWDIELGKVSQTLSGSKAFLSIDYSPLNSCLISGSCDRHIRLWDLRSNEGSLVKQAYTSHKGWISDVYWCPTNEYLFVSASYDGMVKQWDTRSSLGPLYDLLGHEDKVLAVDWTNASYIVSGSADKNLKIYQS